MVEQSVSPVTAVEAETKLSLIVTVVPECLRVFTVPPVLPSKSLARLWMLVWVPVWQEPHWLTPLAPSWLIMNE